MQRLLSFAIALLLFGPLAATVWAHDPYETTMRAYLRAQNFELRITLNARTVELLLEMEGQSLTNAAAPENFEVVRETVTRRAPDWFSVRNAGGVTIPDQVYVTRGVEDHIEVVMAYRRPPSGVMTFEGAYLKQLPSDEPYGANFSIVDLANNVVLGQKVFSATDAVFKTTIPHSARPSAAPSGENKP